MTNYKEIVTKAVIGKGKRTIKKSYNLTPEQTPDTILGCWVINNRFSGKENNGSIGVNGSFDVNVWYSYDNDSKTAVSTKNFTYDDNMKMHTLDNTKLNSDSEIIVRSLKQPTVVDVKINNGEVDMDIETDLGIEVVGNTKIRVPIEDEFEDYETIEDDEEVEDKIESEVNTEYLD